MNEVSTIATAYAFAGFATDATHVSSSGTALAKVGIANAFANATNLEMLGTGVALAVTPAGNGTVPQTEINTLANILASCTATGAAGSSGCTTLFGDALSGGSTGATPTDTATAAINIAHNPAANVGALFQLAGSGVFSPAASSAYAFGYSYALPITFSGGGFHLPEAIAIDGFGNAWVTNFAGNSVTELSSLGTFLSGASGYTGGGLNGPDAIAIDGSGNAWITNQSGNSVTELSSTGTILSGANGYTGGGLDYPTAVAIDGSGNVWVANVESSSLTKLSNSGVMLSGTSGFSTGPGTSWQPNGIAIDGSGNAWVPTYSVVEEFSNSGAVLSGKNGYQYNSFLLGSGVAVDNSGDAWVMWEKGIDIFSGSGSVVFGTNAFTDAGLQDGINIAIDGTGLGWATASGSSGTVVELSRAGSILSESLPGTIYGFGGVGNNVYEPYGVAVDGSGNTWITDTSYGGAHEFIGAATPVIMPIAAGLPATPTANGSSNLGTRP
jgi:hypothetical protein